MGFIFKAIEAIINIAILIGLMGGLWEATLYVAGEVASLHKRRLSFSDLNYQLMEKETYCKNISWKDRRCEGK